MAKILGLIVATLVVASVVSLDAPADKTRREVGHAAVGHVEVGHSHNNKLCKPPYLNLGGGCYLFVRQPKNWWKAQEYCRGRSGKLVKIDSPTENKNILDYLNSINSKENYFVGGYDLGHEGTWYWESTRTPMVYEDWARGQPDNQRGEEHCMVIDITSSKWTKAHQHEWHDWTCNWEFPFICEPF